MCNYMQQITLTLPRDTGTWLSWKRFRMPDQTQQILHDLTKASMGI